MRRVSFAIRAQADLHSIRDYWSDFSESYALRLITSIRSQCRRLANHPRIGRRREELHADLRSFPVMSHVIYYVQTPRGVAIVRVIHGARDISATDFS